MTRVAQAQAKAAVGVAALGLSFVWAPVGVALASVVSLLSVFSIMGLNVPAVRLAYLVALAAQAGAVYVGSGSALLPAAIVLAGVTGMPGERALLSLGRLFRFTPLGGSVIACGLVLLSWPPSWWALSLLPNLFVGLVFGPQLALSARRWPELLRQVKLRVGEPLPELTLPYRDGSGELDFAKERGHALLVLFLRGDWCPICHVLMRVVNRERAALERAGAKLLLISPAEGQLDSELAQQLDVKAHMLLDRNAAVARRWGLLEQEKDDDTDIPLPVALLVDADGIIRDITRPEDVTAYSSRERITRQLELLQPA